MASWTQRAGTMAPVNNNSVTGTSVGVGEEVGSTVGEIGDGVSVAVCVGGIAVAVNVVVGAIVAGISTCSVATTVR